MERFAEYRRQVLEEARRLARDGLLSGTGGNVSCRIAGEDLLAITGSGVDYRELELQHICVVDFRGRQLAGESRPSLETGLHSTVYRRRGDVGAVAHTHQAYASLFSLIGRSIPPLTDEQVRFLGKLVEVVPYAISGSPELAEQLEPLLADHGNAFILQNHGTLVLGISLEQMDRNVRILEKTAQIYYLALSLGRPVSLLPAASVTALFNMLREDQRQAVRRFRRRRHRGAAVEG
jgi:ribulose-5-phosphate 4-epimerase/fuculose-1-phosphate aldolase